MSVVLVMPRFMDHAGRELHDVALIAGSPANLKRFRIATTVVSAIRLRHAMLGWVWWSPAIACPNQHAGPPKRPR